MFFMFYQRSDFLTRTTVQFATDERKLRHAGWAWTCFGDRRLRELPKFHLLKTV